jgi:hypothetical protein
MTSLRDEQLRQGFTERAASAPSLRDYKAWVMQQVDSQELSAYWDSLLPIDKELSIPKKEEQKIRTEVMTYVNTTIHYGIPHQIPWHARIVQEGGPLISASLRHIMEGIMGEGMVGGAESPADGQAEEDLDEDSDNEGTAEGEEGLDGGNDDEMPDIATITIDPTRFTVSTEGDRIAFIREYVRILQQPPNPGKGDKIVVPRSNIHVPRLPKTGTDDQGGVTRSNSHVPRHCLCLLCKSNPSKTDRVVIGSRYGGYSNGDSRWKYHNETAGGMDQKRHPKFALPPGHDLY